MSSRPPIGEMIVGLIRRHGDTFVSAAERIGVSESLLAHVINGRRSLSEDVENRMLRAFSMDDGETKSFRELANYSRGLNFRPSNREELELVIEFQRRLQKIQQAKGQKDVGKHSLQEA